MILLLNIILAQGTFFYNYFSPQQGNKSYKLKMGGGCCVLKYVRIIKHYWCERRIKELELRKKVTIDHGCHCFWIFGDQCYLESRKIEEIPQEINRRKLTVRIELAVTANKFNCEIMRPYCQTSKSRYHQSTDDISD